MGSSKKVTVGYKYYLGMHMVICHGPIDYIHQIKVDKRLAWNGFANGGAIVIDEEGLFGGESREGGISGTADIAMGGSGQTQNSYLQSQLGNDIPGFLGVVSIILNQFYLGMNPYLKRWAFRASRLLLSTNGAEQWNKTKAAIGYTANRAIYIALDLSGSMDTSTGSGTRLENAQQALEDAFTPLLGLNSTSSVDIKVQGFGGSIITITRTNVDGSDIQDIIDWINARSTSDVSGATDFELGMNGASTFFAAATGKTPSIVFITDGEANPASSDIAAGAILDSLEVTYPDLKSYGINIDLSNTDDTAYVDNTPEDGIPVVSGGDSAELTRVITRAFSAHFDMNPSHIIRECLTDTNWGMGYLTADIDDTAFMAAADSLYNEGMGISLLWDRQIPIEDFISEIVRHINAVLYVDRISGKFVLKLIRDDYNEGTLLELDETNIIRVTDYSRTDPSDVVNSVTVVFWDHTTGEDSSVTADDIALIQQQGTVIGTTIQYPGFTNSFISGLAAARDLQTLSSPLLSATIEANREASSLNIGDVFKFYYPDYHDSYVIMRVHQIALGDGKSNRVKITCTEDVFYLPPVALISNEEPGFEEIGGEPEIPLAKIVQESPYFELVQNLGETTINDLLATNMDIGYLMAAAARPANGLNCQIWVDPGSGYEDSGILDFSPYCELAASVGKTETSWTIQNDQDLDIVNLGSYAQIGDELIRIDAIDTGAGTMTVGRAILDTAPSQHLASAPILFLDEFSSSDNTEYVDSEEIDVKLLTNASQGTLALSAVTEDTIIFDSRAFRPYPPGDFRIDGQSYPIDYSIAESATFTWKHRDRIQQTSGNYYDHTDDSIGPEDGTTYHVKSNAYDSDLNLVESDWLDEDIGLVLTWDFVIADETIPGGTEYIEIEMYSSRDGYLSWQAPSTIFSVSLGLWSPSQLETSPGIWLDWSSDLTEVSGAASEWSNNKGSVGGLFEQTTADDRPSVETTGLNGKRWLQFDGSNDFMDGSGSGILDFVRNVSSSWMFTVAKQNNTSQTDGFIFTWADDSGSNARYSQARSHSSDLGSTRLYLKRLDAGATDSLEDNVSFDDTDWHLGFSQFDLSSTEALVSTDGGPPTEDSSFSTSGNTSDTQSGSASLASNSSQSVAADLSIALVIGGSDSLPTFAERQRLEGWAASQCGLESNLPSTHPFKSVPPYINTPVLQTSFISGTTIIGFIAATNASNVGVAAGPAPATEFGTLFNDEPSLSGSEGITITSDGADISVRLDDLTPAQEPAWVALLNHQGELISVIPLTDQTGYFDGTNSGVLTDGGAYYAAVFTLATDIVQITDGDWRTIQRSTDTQGDKGNNHTRVWWNSSQSRWDGIARYDDTGASGSDCYITKDLNGTPSQTSIETNSTRNTGRADVAWDDANGVLYSVDFHGTTTNISTFNYDDGTDTYSTGSVTEVTVTDMDYTNELMAGSMGLAPNGDVWVCTLKGTGLYIQRSQDGGATWLGSGVQLDSSVTTGQADLCFFEEGGNTYVLVIGTEDGDGASVVYIIDITSNDATISNAANWTEETLPALGGTSGSDNHVSAHTGTDGRVYVAFKAEGGSASDVQMGLYVRATGGAWTKYDVLQIGSLANDNLPTRPVVVTDDKFVYYIISDWDGGGLGPAGRDTGDVILKFCEIGSEGALLDAEEYVIMTGSNFENPTVSRECNPSNRILVLAHTTADTGYTVEIGSWV